MSRIEAYMDSVEGATGYKRELGRLHKLAGRPPTLLGSHALATLGREAPPSSIEWNIGSAAGLIAGGIIGGKHGHWLLGAISGASLFTNVPALLKPGSRQEAFWNLAQHHGAVLASLAMQQNRALGFVLGYLGVGAVRVLYGEGH